MKKEIPRYLTGNAGPYLQYSAPPPVPRVKHHYVDIKGMKTSTMYMDVVDVVDGLESLFG